MLRRDRPAEGRQRFFLAPRPVPTRIAGYEPAPPVETGRVPTGPIRAEPLTTPVSPADAPAPQPVPAPPPVNDASDVVIYPPTIPTPFPIVFINPPPVIIPPVVIPPVNPPCDPHADPHCPGGKEPPVEASEPGVLILLMIGGLIVWFALRRRRVANR